MHFGDIYNTKACISQTYSLYSLPVVLPLSHACSNVFSFSFVISSSLLMAEICPRRDSFSFWEIGQKKHDYETQ